MDPRIAASFDRAAERLRRHVDRPQRADALGVRLARTTAPTPMVFVQFPPCLSVVLSGRKRSGDEQSAEREWGPERFLITPVDLPMFARVVAVGQRGDFLSLNWRLDPTVVVEVASQLPRTPRTGHPGRLGTMTVELADAIDRLLALLDEPETAPVLAPLLSRELVLRLLASDQAPRLLAAATQVHADAVTDTIHRLSQNLAGPWTLDALAAAVGVSAPTLTRRFRELTGLPPMRYLKRLRLGEARRLMLTEGSTAAQSAAAVGYLSASHFSRDYRAVYNTAPATEARTLRNRMTPHA